MSTRAKETPARDWQQIAEEMVQERDSERLIQLATELNLALERHQPMATQESDSRSWDGNQGSAAVA